MKKIFWMMLYIISIVCIFPLIAAAQKDKVEGYWYNEEKDAKIEVYKAKNGKFYGKIVWLKVPETEGKPRTDLKNPKENLRNQPIMGLLILKAFDNNGDKVYDQGTIYDPKSGKTYSCKITFVNNQTLSIRGYIGISMIGRTTTWTRTTL